jgi:predicted 2-oxoglutarate/Fe(II)-dependent dioxygenase YbiX
MDTDLKSYYKIYKNRISQELSNEVIDNLKAIDFEQHTFTARDGNHATARAISGNQELDVAHAHSYRNNKVEDIIWNTIKDYHDDINLAWMHGWNGFSFPRWNKYKETRKMAPHVDLIKTLFDGERKGDPTLSVLGLLKTEFTGGEFTLLNDIITDFEPGDIIVFPSNFLYPHKVDPVITGERYSFISWTW